MSGTGSPIALAAQHGPTSPGAQLRAIAHRHNATFTAGPARGRHGLVAAYSVVPSQSAVHRTRDVVQILRYRGEHWHHVASLGSVRDGSYKGTTFWDFPDFSLQMMRIPGLKTRAVVGQVNGAYPLHQMMAVDVHGRWKWASFLGCHGYGICRHRTTVDRTIVIPKTIRHGDLITTVGVRKSSCQRGTQVIRSKWRWSGSESAFVELRSMRSCGRLS